MTHRQLFSACVIAATALLSGCTAVEHLQSQQRLVDGVHDVFSAENATYGAAAELQSSAAAAVGRPDLAKKIEPTLDWKRASLSEQAGRPSPQSARLALAADAKNDFDKVTSLTSNVEPLDRISYLYRAAVKSWHSGGVDGSLVSSVREAGSEACDDLGNTPRPPRDCAMFDYVVNLTIAEAATDRLNDIEAEMIFAAWNARTPGQRLDLPYERKQLTALHEALVHFQAALIDRAQRFDTSARFDWDAVPASADTDERMIEIKTQAYYEQAANHGGASDTDKALVWETLSAAHPQLRAFVDRQLVLYWCYADKARAAISLHGNVGARKTMRQIDADARFATITRVLVEQRKFDLGNTAGPRERKTTCIELATSVRAANQDLYGAGLSPNL